jgi:hypothetical protein
MFQDSLPDGKRILITGASAYYLHFDRLSDADWARMRELIKAQNEKDRAARTT